MALLLAILFGLGRLSADREFVALQACGVSIFRMLRPIALLAAVATAADRLRDDRRAAGREPEVPRNHLQHPRRRAPKATSSRASSSRDSARTAPCTCATSAGRGGVARRVPGGLDRPTRRRPISPSGGGWPSIATRQTVELVLENGARHTTYLEQAGRLRRRAVLAAGAGIDAQTACSRVTTLIKGDNEMTIAELRAKIAENTKAGSPSLQPAVHHPAEVRASRRLRRAGAHRPGAWRHESKATGRSAGS